MLYWWMFMQIVNSLADPLVVSALRRGRIVVARTDTIYGILARADDDQVVTRVYALKHRADHKSPIILIHDIAQLFDVVDDEVLSICRSYWPGKTTIILPSREAPVWIRRDNHSVAYRLPDHPELLDVIGQVGPLIAPSANPEGETPAVNIDQAVEYFGDAVDVYVDGGEVTDNTPSQLLRIDEQGAIERLR